MIPISMVSSQFNRLTYLHLPLEHLNKQNATVHKGLKLLS